MVTKMEIQEHNRRRRIEVESVLADPTKMALLDDVFATSDFKRLGSITLFRDVLRTLRRRQHNAERDTCQQALSVKRPHRPCRDRVSRTERYKED